MEVGYSRKSLPWRGCGVGRELFLPHTEKKLLIPYTLLSENRYFPIEEFFPSLIVLISPKVSFHTPMGEPIGLVLVVFLPNTRCCCRRLVP